MVRTQIQLTAKQAKSLKKLAGRQHVSMATLVRQGVDKVLASAVSIADEERKRER